MRFEKEDRIVYCKDESYKEKFDNQRMYYNHIINMHYCGGYLVHREDGPAIIWSDGSEDWICEGKYHRKRGPAVKRKNGHKEWWHNGVPHRKGGPAIEWRYGDKSWWLNGKEYNEKEYWNVMNLKKKKRVLDEI
jgi:hypothetical protein